ncbi:hypothetical protein ACFP3Q_14975 [Nocardioides sp. GCM10027113]|uniref:hypothetical protein n=1 Tax=unclassified Nocardioides TaxID=2615069 RepID=UPI003622449A
MTTTGTGAVDRGRAAIDRGRAAVDLLGVLYPPPLVVRIGIDPAVGTTRAAWTGLPSVANPRLLVARAGPLASARLLRRQLTGSRLRTRAARAGLSLAAATGVLGRLPAQRISIVGDPGSPSIEDPLREALGTDRLRLTMPVGPARSNRKPVLQVTDEAGRVLAFGKVGHTDLTKRLVRREATALTTLAVAALPGLRAPARLAQVAWHDCEVLLLEPLPIPARRLSGDDARRRLVDLVREIASITAGPPAPWGGHAFRARLLQRAEGCAGFAGRLHEVVERVPTRLELAPGAWHGDLNPGNVALVRGPCPVWDWERFEPDVPRGFDLLHHRLHEAITVLGMDPRVAASLLVANAPATLTPLGVGGEAATATARLYLVTLACRYLEDDQRAAGGDLGRVEEWLLPALEEAPS